MSVRLAALNVLLAIDRGGTTLPAEVDRARKGLTDERDRGLLVELTAGTKYRFLAAGDNNAKDVDLEVQDATGKVVVFDERTNPEAVVDFTPTVSGRYLVRIRLYDSQDRTSCVCLGVVMSKSK